MKSRGTITAACILALAAMFAAVLGVHAFHGMVHCSSHQSDRAWRDSEADNHAESGVSHDHCDNDSTAPAVLQACNEASSGGSCPVCDFLKTRPVQSCFGAVDLHHVYTPPSAPIVRAYTPISRRHALPRLSRAPPASFPMHIV
jgi:hypothetical protein